MAEKRFGGGRGTVCAALERVREIYFGYGPPPRPKESFFLYELKPDP